MTIPGLLDDALPQSMLACLFLCPSSFGTKPTFVACICVYDPVGCSELLVALYTTKYAIVLGCMMIELVVLVWSASDPTLVLSWKLVQGKGQLPYLMGQLPYLC